MDNKQRKKILQDIANQDQNSIEKQVALEALNYDDIKNFFSDIMIYGCKTGMVSALIQYADIHTFFDIHYAQIEDLRQDFEQHHGVPMIIKNDLKKHLACFAFKQTAYIMAQELGLDI